MTAPAESDTVPRIVPVNCCAQAGTQRQASRKTLNKVRRIAGDWFVIAVLLKKLNSRAEFLMPSGRQTSPLKRFSPPEKRHLNLCTSNFLVRYFFWMEPGNPSKALACESALPMLSLLIADSESV